MQRRSHDTVLPFWRRGGCTIRTQERAPQGAQHVSKPVELYTVTGCPHGAAAREDLEWRGIAFVEYDVAQDAVARVRRCGR